MQVPSNDSKIGFTEEEEKDATPSLEGRKDDSAPLERVISRGRVDGGLPAWLVVCGAFCCLFCGFGWVNGVNSTLLALCFTQKF